MSQRGQPDAAGAADVARLEAAAKAWERDVVIPHCAVCERPCCALTDVVLELTPPEAETLYRITPASKQLPSTVRAQHGRFFAHGAPCPAFAVGTRRCTIYDTGRKPVACADFPVYADGDVVTADRRCEAVAAGLEGLEDALMSALAPGESLVVLADAEHPDVFVSFAVERAAPPPGRQAPPPAPSTRPPRSPPRPRPGATSPKPTTPRAPKAKKPTTSPKPSSTPTTPSTPKAPPPWRRAPEPPGPGRPR